MKEKGEQMIFTVVRKETSAFWKSRNTKLQLIESMTVTVSCWLVTIYFPIDSLLVQLRAVLLLHRFHSFGERFHYPFTCFYVTLLHVPTKKISSEKKDMRICVLVICFAHSIIFKRMIYKKMKLLFCLWFLGHFQAEKHWREGFLNTNSIFGYYTVNIQWSVM